jgi:molybdopterin molybdotransferase
MADDCQNQTMETEPPLRIPRLTPLAEVLALIDARVMPVAARACPVEGARGHVLAEDAAVPSALPAAPLALRDGYAVRSEATADASSYAPALLAAAPERVDIGAVVPPEADAVAPLDAVVERDGRFEAVAPVAPGEGVIAHGADFTSGAAIRRAGERLRLGDAAALIACGVAQVKVRTPRVSVLWRSRAHDPRADAAAHLIMSGIKAAGGQSLDAGVPVGNAQSWDAPFREPGVDLVIAYGSALSGSADSSVRALGRAGEVAVHGIAISPGETAAIGFVGSRPVLVVPGRIDAAFAVWHLLGRHILSRLAGCAEDPPAMKRPLARKISSSLGLAELVPVRLRDGKAEPIASGYLPLSALSQADGWILIPPDREGYPPGTEVVIRPCA